MVRTSRLQVFGPPSNDVGRARAEDRAQADWLARRGGAEPMNVQIELWQLITLLLAFFGACGATGKLLLAQTQRHVDASFAAQDRALSESHAQTQRRLEEIQAYAQKEAEQWRQIERELHALKADLPLRFVMRDDYVRGQTVIESKLDALAVRVDNLNLRSMGASK
jgi:hypothetical protein